MINLLYTYRKVQEALECMEHVKEQMDTDDEYVDIYPMYIYDKAVNIIEELESIKKHIGYE